MLTYSLNQREASMEVTFQGDFDIEGTEIIEEELIPTLRNYSTVHLNFSDVPFVDSSGMGLLLNLVHTLHDLGARVKVVQVRDEVMEVFELLQLPDILGAEVFS